MNSGGSKHHRSGPLLGSARKSLAAGIEVFEIRSRCCYLVSKLNFIVVGSLLEGSLFEVLLVMCCLVDGLAT